MSVIASLLGAIIWNLITWWAGIPSSSSHALIGSLTGAVVSAAGFSAINSARLYRYSQGTYIFTVDCFHSRIHRDVDIEEDFRQVQSASGE